MEIYDVKEYTEYLLKNVSSDFERAMYKRIIYDKNIYKKIKYLPNIPYHLLHIRKFRDVIKALQLIFSIKIGLQQQKNSLIKSSYDNIYHYYSCLYDMLIELCIYSNTININSDDNIELHNELNEKKLFYLATELTSFVKC